MHIQWKDKVSWFSRKRYLLYMLFFSVLLLSAAMYRLIQKNNWLKQEFSKQEVHIRQKEEIEKLGLLIKTAESDSRGYALTGNQQFLRNFSVLLDSINSVTYHLKLMVAAGENTETPVQYSKLSSFIDQKIALMQRGNALALHNPDSAVSLFAGKERNNLTDSIGYYSVVSLSRFNTAINESKSSFWSVLNANNQVTYYSIIASVLLVLIAFFFLVKEILAGKQMGKELELQKERYRTTLSSMTEGVITTNQQGEIIYMNPAAELITGWRKQEAKNLPLHRVYDVSVESTGQRVDNIVSRILKEGIPIELENNTILKTKHHNELIINNSGSPLFNSNGNVTGAVLVFNDITPEKKSKQQLKESEEKYRNLIEQAADGIFILDQQGRFTEVNSSGCSMMGYSKEEVLGLHLSDITPAQFIDKMPVNMRDLINGKTLLIERQYLRKDGSVFYAEATAKLIAGEKIQSIVRDITERKQAEMKLQKALDRYNILAKATSDTIWDWDMQGEKMKYNEGVTTMLGYEKSVVENIPDWWKQNIHRNDQSSVTEKLAEVFLTKQQTIQLSYRFRCADGNYKYIFDRAFVLYDEQGKPIRVIGAMQDVTYEKEEEIRISKAIVDAQEAERQQLGMELHDNVNQILSVSLLYLGIAREQQKKEADFSVTIDTCKKHISEAINEIRKLSHQLTPASKDDISFKEVFESLIASLTLNSNISVLLYFGHFEEELVRKDILTTLYRILQEQMNNIFKYADADTVEIDVMLQDDIISLRIADNGKGFDPGLVSKGIGLSNIKRRAEMYGGKYSCYSSPGKGCEITVGIPLTI